MRWLTPFLGSCVLTAAVAAPAAAQLTFTQIADSNTVIPDGTGNFTPLFSVPAVSGGTVAFVGNGSGAQFGIYSFTGGTLARIADKNSVVPNGTGTFSGFDTNTVTLSGSTAAFIGNWGGGTQTGLYAGSAGTPLVRVVDSTTAVPGGSGTFQAFGSRAVTAVGSTVAYRGFDGALVPGVYTTAGTTTTRFADTTTAIPGGTGNFTGFFGSVGVAGSRVYYSGTGTSGQAGVYSTIGASTTRIADLTTAIPGGTGSFTGISGTLDVSGTRVAFVAAGANSQSGVYTSSGGPLTRIADTTTPAPGGGTFSFFGNVAVAGSATAFTGFTTTDDFALFLYDGTTISRIVGTDDVIAGRTVNNVQMGPDGFDGTTFAFKLEFTDGSAGIFTTTVPVPEPTTVTLLGLATVVVVAHRRRRATTAASDSK